MYLHSHDRKTWAWGRECKLGWGWNESWNYLIPVEGEPPNVTSASIKTWDRSAQLLSPTDIQCWVSFLFSG